MYQLNRIYTVGASRDRRDPIYRVRGVGWSWVGTFMVARGVGPCGTLSGGQVCPPFENARKDEYSQSKGWVSYPAKKQKLPASVVGTIDLDDHLQRLQLRPARVD